MKLKEAEIKSAYLVSTGFFIFYKIEKFYRDHKKA
jgi:hypothetical protein